MAIMLSFSGAALLCVVDQLVKAYIVNHYTVGMSVPLIEGVLHATYAQNYGAVFGMGQGTVTILAVASGLLLAALAVTVVVRGFRHPLEGVCMTLILAGGVGNLIDRLWRGFVVDYIDVRFISFYIFNLADSFVVCGCILLAAYILFFYSEPQRQAADDQEDETL